MSAELKLPFITGAKTHGAATSAKGLYSISTFLELSLSNEKENFFVDLNYWETFSSLRVVFVICACGKLKSQFYFTIHLVYDISKIPRYLFLI